MPCWWPISCLRFIRSRARGCAGVQVLRHTPHFCLVFGPVVVAAGCKNSSTRSAPPSISTAAGPLQGLGPPSQVVPDTPPKPTSSDPTDTDRSAYGAPVWSERRLPTGAVIPCAKSVGRKRADRLAEECLLVSPATHPPCNAQNPCMLIVDEIKWGCDLARDPPGKVPAFCVDFTDGGSDGSRL